MNNYIINPSVFYWMNVLNILHILNIIFFSFGLVFVFIGIICYAVYTYNSIVYPTVYEHGDKVAKIWRKIAIIAGIVSIFSGLMMIFIPDKYTSIEMLIAKTATYENAQLTVQGIKEIVDYIIQAIKSI